MKVGELCLEINAKGDISLIDTATKKMKSAFGASKQLKAGIMAFAASMYALNKVSTDMAVMLKNFAVSTGLSTEELQKWTYAAEQNDIATEELIGSIKALEMNRAKIMKGEGNISPYQLLGLDPRQDPFELLEQLQERLQGLDPALAREQVGQLGLSENMLNLLKQGNLELYSLKSEFILTKKETADLLSLNKAWKDLFFIIRQITAKLAAMNVKPFLEIVKVLKNVGEFLYKIASGLSDMVQQSQTLKAVLIGVGAVALIAFAPMTAAITAILLVLEDLAVYFSGSGNSVFGLIVEGFKNINENIDKSVSKWKYLGKAISEPMQAIGDLVGQIVGLVENFNFDNLERFLSTVAKYLNPAGAVGEWVSGKVGAWAKDKLGGESGVGPMPNPAGINNSQTNNFNTNVYGVDNPSAVKQAVKSGFEESVEYAAFQTPKYAQ
jgi:hypothetical protein